MASFVGDYTGKVDAKGRISFPSAFKKQMPEDSSTTFVIKKDIFEKCLILFSSEEWERQNKIIRAKINPYNKEHTRFLREFYRGTAELTLDSSSRLLVPARLLEYADVENEIYFSGQDRKIEIWAKKSYEEKEQTAEDFAALAEKIMGGELPGDLLNE